MTDPRRQRFAKYLRKLADRLALRDWQVRIDPRAPDIDMAVAQVECVYGRKLAAIAIGEIFLGDTPAEQRHTLVHELIHCHLDPALQIGLESLPEDVRPAFRRMVEHAVDGMADAIAPLLPLPPKGK